MAVVEIGVLSGHLATPVRVRVFTMDASAKSIQMIMTHGGNSHCVSSQVLKTTLRLSDLGFSLLSLGSA